MALGENVPCIGPCRFATPPNLYRLRIKFSYDNDRYNFTS